MDLKQVIREIPNWPINGVNFKDISTLIEDAQAFRLTIDQLAEPYLEKPVDKVIGIDARGFLFCSAMAYKLGVGCVMVRKKGKLPPPTVSRDYALEYGSSTMEMRHDSLKPGDNVILVDDLLATGGTMAAAVDLVKQTGGRIIGLSFIVELAFLKGRAKLSGYPLYSLVSYASE